jgi:hypothetical protein
VIFPLNSPLEGTRRDKKGLIEMSSARRVF